MWSFVIALSILPVIYGYAEIPKTTTPIPRDIDIAVVERHIITEKEDYTLTCSQEPLELGIVLDSSKSIEQPDFDTVITFLQNYLRQMDIGSGPDNIRVSIILYGLGVYTKDSFNLTTYETKQEVIDAIGRIVHEKSIYTDTSKGIEYMRRVQLAKGMVRPGVTKVGLVITDGNSQQPHKTKQQAEWARKDGIIMFAVGVGTEVSVEELNNIAGDSSRVARVDSFDELNSIIQKLANMTCVKIPKTTTPIPQTPETTPIRTGVLSQQGFDESKEIPKTTTPIPRTGVLSQQGFDESKATTRKTTLPTTTTTTTRKPTTTTTTTRKPTTTTTTTRKPTTTTTTTKKPTTTTTTTPKPTTTTTTTRKPTTTTTTTRKPTTTTTTTPKPTTTTTTTPKPTTTTTTTPKPTTTKTTTPKPPCGVSDPSDVYFVFSPADLGTTYTAWTTSFISRTISSEDMDIGFRYGVISGSCPDDAGFNLDRYRNVKDIRQQIQSYDVSKMVSLTRKLANNGFTAKVGGREKSGKVAVLFVVGSEKSRQDLAKEIGKLVNQGVEVFIADPLETFVLFPGAITLQGNMNNQTSELVDYLCPK